MAYIKETISVYGDKTDFATALKNFFVNNELVPFELISEDLTANIPTFTIERNNLNLKFNIAYSGITSQVIVSSKVSEDEYSVNGTYGISHTQAENTSSISRTVQILLINNEDIFVLQIAPWNATSVSQGITVLDSLLSNGLNLIGSGMYSSGITTITLKETTTQLTYTVRPFHTGSNDETKLILSNTLAVNNSSGVYVADMLGVISAGGAKQFGYYITALNTYYGLLNDVCIPLGDRVEYISSNTIDETTE